MPMPILNGCSKIAAALLQDEPCCCCCCCCLRSSRIAAAAATRDEVARRHRHRYCRRSFVINTRRPLRGGVRTFLQFEKEEEEEERHQSAVIPHTHTLSTCTSVTNRGGIFRVSNGNGDPLLISSSWKEPVLTLCVSVRWCPWPNGSRFNLFVLLFFWIHWKWHQPTDWWSLQVQLHCSIVRAVLFSCRRAINQSAAAASRW